MKDEYKALGREIGDWGTSIMSGWIEHCAECADFIDECTARKV